MPQQFPKWLRVSNCIYCAPERQRVKLSLHVLVERAVGFFCGISSGRIFFFFFNFIKVQLIYNVVLISAVQQTDSVIHIYIPFLF